MTASTPTRKSKLIAKGWKFDAINIENFEVELVVSERSAKKSVKVTSNVLPAHDLGSLAQECSCDKYLGQRVKYSAWVKTELSQGTAQLWVRVDGNWPVHGRIRGTFDNMWPDRLISGKSEWTKYELVVEVPTSSIGMGFGIYHNGVGTIWFSEPKFEVVSKDTPLTGLLDSPEPADCPFNLDFEIGES